MKKRERKRAKSGRESRIDDCYRRRGTKEIRSVLSCDNQFSPLGHFRLPCKGETTISESPTTATGILIFRIALRQMAVFF